MARFLVRYRCPECVGEFKFPFGEEPPDRCPLCNAWVSEAEPPEFTPKAPAIRKSAYAKSIDQVYRATEAASIERANEAAGVLESAYAAQPRDAESTGLLAETQRKEITELRSDLKMTNMKDPSQTREGENSWIPPRMADGNSPVTRGAAFQMTGGGVPDVMPGVGGGRANVDALRAPGGGFAGHTNRAPAMIRAGTLGSYRE